MSFCFFFFQGKSCKLAVGSINNIVSHGTIIEVDAENHTVHGVPLGEGNIRVAIDAALDEQALLPIPVTEELVTVGQAVGSHVAWPKHLVKLMDEEVNNHATIFRQWYFILICTYLQNLLFIILARVWDNI